MNSRSLTTELAQEKILAYAVTFLSAYSEALAGTFRPVVDAVGAAGRTRQYFPLADRRIGADVSLALFFTDFDFYLYFLDEPGLTISVLVDGRDSADFDRDWTMSVPSAKRDQQVKLRLGLLDRPILKAFPEMDSVGIPGTNFMSRSIEEMQRDARQHGLGAGNQAGDRAERDLPEIRRGEKDRQTLEGFAAMYRSLQGATDAQARGRKFETLWQSVLEFYGWRPKKFRILGEENDFTAIYQGLHVLGEVRWYAEPMTGGKLREFLGKLDPRPQTIGLFISHSGLDEGTWSVIRRAVNSKTVVVFERDEIESVLAGGAAPGPIFDVKLRDAYDHIFEQRDRT